MGYHLLLVFLLLFPLQGGAFFDALDVLRQELFLEGAVTEPPTFNDLIQKVAGSKESGEFTDVDPSAWYAPYVKTVALLGIVSGYKDAEGNPLGLFGPGDPLRISEILKMALKAARIDEGTCTKAPLHPQAQNHWARNFVACAEERGFRLFKDFPDLNRPAQRGEVLVMIHDAFEEVPPPLLSTFRDTAGHPFESDIAYAAARGIVSGDTDRNGILLNTFRPNDEINRAEAAKILEEQLRAEVEGTTLIVTEASSSVAPPPSPSPTPSPTPQILPSPPPIAPLPGGPPPPPFSNVASPPPFLPNPTLPSPSPVPNVVQGPPPPPLPPPSPPPPPPAAAGNTSQTITYTDSGFSPTTLAAQRGSVVTFRNSSLLPMWVASNDHPYHRLYPGSDIEKCIGVEASTIFDACRGIQPGQQWTFTFLSSGTWGYHNHLAPSHRGVITVQP